MSAQVNISAAVFEDLELWEMEEFEELCGVALADVVNGAPVPIRATAALVFIVKRKSDPTFTYEDARRVKLSEVAEILNPTSAAPTQLAPLARPTARKSAS